MLPASDLSNQLSCIDVLQSIYCLPGEIVIDASDAATLERLRGFLDTAAADARSLCLPNGVNITLRVDSVGSVGHTGTAAAPLQSVRLCIAIPLTRRNGCSLHPQLSLRCPEWLDRKGYDRLVDDCAAVLSLPEDPETDSVEYVTRAVDHLQTILVKYCTEAPTPADPLNDAHAMPSISEYPSVLRVWYWLPSLSTKSKRTDLVTYAAHPTKDARPPLTGFVLAGKPGIICLESSLIPAPTASTPPSASPESIRAASAQIDAYWRHIKTESWSDIPPAHKKVSERLREECVPRAFGNALPADGPGILGARGMVEVTGMLRESMRGHKSNRGDLSMLIRWIDGPDGVGGRPRGLGSRLEKVLGAEWTAEGGA